jgi:hypothetical protein
LTGHLRWRWVYFLPALHLCACFFFLLTYLLPPGLQFLAIVWEFVMLADLPVSLRAYGLAWKYGWLAVMWIVVAGTLWWYLLSRGAAFLFAEFRNKRPDPSKMFRG